MIKIIRFCCLLVSFWGFIACQQDKKDTVLRQAEESIEVCPDSAIQILEKMDGIAFDFDYQYAKYALLWTQARHKCHLPLGNDSLINVAVDYYTQHEERHYAAKALLYKGLVHKERKEVEKAAEAFALSEQWFSGVEDDQYKALLYNHYGLLMQAEENFEDALHYYKKSYYYKLKGDSIHYIMSACGTIANAFRYLNQPDSAKVYFEKGLQYKEDVSPNILYLFQQNYANFLRANGEYVRAEKMLMECERYVKNENRYSLYSSLATLYYDMKDYSKSLHYAEMMQESQDSLVLRGCYLHFYRAYNKMGKDKDATKYRELYLKYYSDINERLKTKEVAVIPFQVRSEILQKENQKGGRVRLMLIIWIMLLVLGGISVFLFVRKRHKKKERDFVNEKSVYKKELDKKEQDNKYLQNLMNWEIGKLQDYIARKDGRIEKMEDDLREKKERIKENNHEIGQLKENEAAIIREKRELEKVLETTLKKQRNLQDVADKAEHDRKIDQRIMCYRVAAKVEHIGALLMQLKHGNMYVSEQIPDEKFRPMIESLLDAERPGMRERIDASTNNLTKQLMCYLIALDLNDEDMMFRATGKKLDTVRKYHKECEALMAGSDWGEGSRW